MDTPPNRQQAHRVLMMLETGLVSWKHLQPWAEEQVEALDAPPSWIGELTSLTYRGDVDRCVRDFVFAPPFELFDLEMLSDYSVSCLVVRHERRELSWRTVLEDAGALVDCRDYGIEPCEFYYEFLNELEDAECNPALEEQQVRTVRQLMAASIAQVTADFAPLLSAFRRRASKTAR